MTQQGAFTSVVEIKADSVDDLRNLLNAIGLVVDEKSCPIPFGRLRTVHFMRWVVLDPSWDVQGRPVPPSLVLSTNYDVPLDDHLEELVSVTNTAGTFDQIYGHCVGFDQKGDRVAYLKAHSVPYAAFYVGTRGRSVAQIHQEQQLRSDIETYLDKTPGLPSDPAQLFATLRKTFTEGPYAWVKTDPAGEPPTGITLITALGLGIALVAGISVLIYWLVPGTLWWLFPGAGLVLAVVLYILALRLYETRERIPEVKTVGAPLADLVRREDQVVQNQLTNVVLIKPSLFRRVTVRLALSAIDLLGRVVFVRGALGGIPSIHFARWVILDHGRLLFMSNFDGSWENYLGDFIDKASLGLNAIWGNTIGCPPTRFLVLDGARDERRFKTWVRENQLVTQVWYSAYRNLSVENINNNTRIRLGLARADTNVTEAEAGEWLAFL